MKCEFCSANMSIENERCPHCDAENPYYKAHRADMEAYAKRFASTESDVVKKTAKFTRKTFNIAATAVLLVIILLLIIVRANMDNINYSIDIAKNNANADNIAKELASYEDSHDYIGMANYFDSLNMKTYKTAVAEYTYVSDVARYCKYIKERLNKIVLDKKAIYSLESEAQDIGRFLNTIYDTRYVNISKSAYYNVSAGPDYYSEKHVAAMDEMIEEIETMLQVYLKIDKETIKNFKDMSEAQRQLILEQKITEVAGDAKEE